MTSKWVYKNSTAGELKRKKIETNSTNNVNDVEWGSNTARKKTREVISSNFN